MGHAGTRRDDLLDSGSGFILPESRCLTGIATSGRCVFAIDDKNVWAIDVGERATPAEVGIHPDNLCRHRVRVPNHLDVTEGWAGFEDLRYLGLSWGGDPR